MPDSQIRAYQQCSQCVLDTVDDPKMVFNAQGVCHYCEQYKKIAKEHLFHGPNAELKLKNKIDQIKRDGKGQKYDCIIGVSGGVDSTYVAYLAKKYELRVLLVHFDNGWNSELAVKNIENITQKLGFDLHTYVIDWEEFKDLQLAFFKASVVDIELVTDHAIFAALYQIARKYKIKHTVNGLNITTEAIMPPHWVHKKNDWLNIQSIHQKFGTIPLKSYPRTGFWENMLNVLVFKVESLPILNYVPYNKQEVKKVITEELGWRDYGGKHYESVFTRFYQAYILPTKFNIDKRKAHLATLICSGQINKQKALDELSMPLYSEQDLKHDMDFVIKKWGISQEIFDQFMSQKPKSHLAYDSYILKHWKWHESFFQTIQPVTRFIKDIIFKKK